uniref:Uncharacterized protein n=1 Tax=Avena sativa TaxID=4498 RepID=A0ACD5Z009_AVESA
MRREALEYYGHGVDGGFYVIDMGGVQMTVPETLAMVSILPDQALPLGLVVTEDLIQEELRAVLPGHPWPFHRVSASEFAVHFPSVAILRMCACGSSFSLPLHQLRVSIQPSSAARDTVATLSEVWVQLSGLPHEARRPEVVALVSQAVGKLTELDMSSLLGLGPIRLRLLCPAIYVFPVSLPRVFFDRVGRDLLVELDEELSGPGGPPSPSVPGPRRR